jgi:eukaryotic-like serine/threonine-protein kinase
MPYFFAETKDTMQFWNELEGQTIDGVYPLRRLVRSEGRSAWFETEIGTPQNTPATISLTEAVTDADEVAERLDAARNLKHPNLVSITKVGQVRIDNTFVVYAVMEHIEQNLAEVLQSQALSTEEGREVAEALVGALTAIHAQGMSHGHVEAASVLATEETVKLRSDCLQMSAASQGDDVAGVGATLFHVFTQRKALTATDAQVNRIPAPFAEIVRNAFARRWTLAQIANALKPGLPPSRAIPPAPVSQPAAARPPAPTPAPARPPIPAPPRVEPRAVKAPERPVAPRPAAPPVPAANPRTLATERSEQRSVSGQSQPGGKRRPLGLYAAVAVGVLAILAWLLMRPHAVNAPVTTPPTVSQAPVAPPTPPPVVTKPSASKPSAGAAGLHPRKPAPPVPGAVSPATTAAGLSSGRNVWRVVVYTYRGQTKATDSVAKIVAEHPDLAAAVFNPAGSDVYMVILGGAMDHNQANAMLDKARKEGLPADTYVRNFSE